MTGGKIHGPGGAAELLDIDAGTFRNRMSKLGITSTRATTLLALRPLLGVRG
jgi:hypothetical protein